MDINAEDGWLEIRTAVVRYEAALMANELEGAG